MVGQLDFVQYWWPDLPNSDHVGTIPHHESGKDDETEWLDEIATLTDEEREEFAAKVRPVKMALVKVSTRAFPSIRMFAHLWASNRFARSPSRS